MFNDMLIISCIVQLSIASFGRSIALLGELIGAHLSHFADNLSIEKPIQSIEYFRLGDKIESNMKKVFRETL